MRRLCLFVVVLLLAPALVEAQPRLMLGGGVTTPNGATSEVAETGYHIQVGLHVSIPTLPVGFRLDGGYHRLGESGAAGAETKVLAGSISMVFALPGVGLNPYLLGGLGQYRVEAGPAERTDRGFHGGFGVVLGALGLGAFAEIRYVRISSDTGPTTKLIPLTVGVRF